MSIFKNYLWMISEHMLRRSKRSYLCPTPRLSKGYKIRSIGSYFYDFTPKINWPGEYDSQGIPVDKNGQSLPIVVIQKALGHHNILSSNMLDKNNRSEFLKYADWVLKRTEANGGIAVSSQETQHAYSAIVQGLAASVLIRAFKVSRKKSYIAGARKVIFFMDSNKNPMMVRAFRHLKTLEEYPSSNYPSVLNGWIFAIFGIYELYLTDKTKKLQELLNENLKNLSGALKYYDAKFWSYYDLNHHYSSTYYHASHIVMLEALSLEFPQIKNFKIYKLRFSKYSNNILFKAFSQSIKLHQKILDPTKPVYKI